MDTTPLNFRVTTDAEMITSLHQQATMNFRDHVRLWAGQILADAVTSATGAEDVRAALARAAETGADPDIEVAALLCLRRY